MIVQAFAPSQLHALPHHPMPQANIKRRQLGTVAPCSSIPFFSLPPPLHVAAYNTHMSVNTQGEQVTAGGLAAAGSHVIMASTGGMLAHFPLDALREAGRAAGCVKVGWVRGGLIEEGGAQGRV